jgi:hypothetical protein
MAVDFKTTAIRHPSASTSPEFARFPVRRHAEWPGVTGRVTRFATEGRVGGRHTRGRSFAPVARPFPPPTCALLYSYSSRLGAIMPAVPTKKKARRKVPLIVAAVVRPVSTRLSRMEALLIEMRSEQDVKLKKINKLQQQFDELTETLKRRLI